MSPITNQTESSKLKINNFARSNMYDDEEQCTLLLRTYFYFAQ